MTKTSLKMVSNVSGRHKRSLITILKYFKKLLQLVLLEVLL